MRPRAFVLFVVFILTEIFDNLDSLAIQRVTKRAKSPTYRILEGVFITILLQMAGNELSFRDLVFCRGQLSVIRPL